MSGVIYANPMNVNECNNIEGENNMKNEGYKYGMPIGGIYPIGTPTPIYSAPILDINTGLNLKTIVEKLKENDVSLSKVVLDLAIIFGADATLEQINKSISDISLPTKTIAGKKYIAGYKGTSIIAEGSHVATLISIVKDGNNNKLLFAIGNYYIYSEPIRFEVLNIVENINIKDRYIVEVEHMPIPNTGYVHAFVSGWVTNDR